MLRELLNQPVTGKDLLLIVSLLFNVVGLFAALVAVDVHYANWRRRREWAKSQRAAGVPRENIRNPRYGMKPKDE